MIELGISKIFFQSPSYLTLSGSSSSYSSSSTLAWEFVKIQYKNPINPKKAITNPKIGPTLDADDSILPESIAFIIL